MVRCPIDVDGTIPGLNPATLPRRPFLRCLPPAGQIRGSASRSVHVRADRLTGGACSALPLRFVWRSSNLIAGHKRAFQSGPMELGG